MHSSELRLPLLCTLCRLFRLLRIGYTEGCELCSSGSQPGATAWLEGALLGEGQACGSKARISKEVNLYCECIMKTSPKKINTLNAAATRTPT